MTDRHASSQDAGSAAPSGSAAGDAGGEAQALPADLAVRVFWLAPGIRAAFTGRSGGLSQPPFGSLNLSAAGGDSPAAVARNRELVAAACGLPASHLVWMRQVHGTDVGYVTAPLAADTAAAVRDANVTGVPGLALAALAADCPTVLVGDPEARIVGVAHSGRQGTAAGVVPALIRAMAGAGAAPGRMHAVIGPAICGGCYEVPAAMRDSVAAQAPGSGCVTRAGTPGLDLRAGITAQLAAAGLRQVRTDERCTAETPDLYSYRRDGRTGRFAGLIWLTP